jgi:hypothetical protein
VLSVSAREIRCPRCSTVNRVAAHSLGQVPRCGNCHASLPGQYPIRILSKLATIPRIIWLYASILLVAVIWGIHAAAPPSGPAAAVGTDTCAGRPQPHQGIFRWYNDDDDVAPFTIRTAAGSNYFVKLENLAGMPIRSFFVYGNSQTTADVPIGSYRLKYATGRSWCNEHDLFGQGPATSTSQAEKVFTFETNTNGNMNSTTAITVELILQKNGNLATHTIDRSRF